jgi:hypothetical protein
MQGIYSYVPETSHVTRVYNAPADLWLLLMLYYMLFSMINVLYFYISTSQSIRAVPRIAVFSFWCSWM